ncbi:MAG TPA: hypothetical protein VIM73_06500, partial [Polyangiaceae bacterium]
MKSIAPFLLLLLLLLPLRADKDILVNSSFTDGHAHWQGDAKDVETGDLSSDTPPPGAVIHLKKDKWTRMFQLFTIRDKSLFYKVSFKLSDDFKIPQPHGNDYVRADLGDVPGLMFQEELSDSAFTLMVQGGDNFQETTIRPDATKLDQSQTFTGRINPYTTGVQAVFIIVFPPGEGTVTLSQASLSYTDPG